MKRLIQLLLVLLPLCLHAQESDFNTYTQQRATITEGQPIEDSLFLCLCLPCDTPSPIDSLLLHLSCFPAERMGINSQYSPYCIGEVKRLPIPDLDTALLPVLFYVEADRDYTKSLVLATFTHDGTEVASQVIASDDPALMAPGETADTKTLRLFQYRCEQGMVYVRQCCYDGDLHLIDWITSSYRILHDGTIKRVDEIDAKSMQRVFREFPLVDKWSVD